MRPGSFADAFYFSVQTFATIGYGFLSPNSDYSNIIVVIEAAVGIAGVALITGLMFTKASKPRPGIIFSKSVTINTMNGKPHLIFRTGNTRQNDVVSAEIMVAVLRDEVLSEGQRVRRMYDLNLVRSKSPFFGLTWLIMHEIDEQSPFYGVRTNEDIAKRILSMTCVLTAHDSTYGQTVYSRHAYFPDDFHVGRKFVDVLAQMPDGRTMVDYGKFHDVE
jgi:inward rectifier potassium channel